MKKIYSLILIIFLFQTDWIAAQSSFVPFPFSINELKLELEPIFDERVLRVTTTYHMERLPGAGKQVSFYSVRNDIESILLNGRIAQYSERNDSLFIEVGEEKEIELLIKSTTEAGYGLYWTADSTLRTAFLPNAPAHWFPVRTKEPLLGRVNINFRIPDHLQAISVGSEVKRNQWTTSQTQKVPLSQVGFVIGKFRQVSQSLGNTTLHIYSVFKVPQDLLSAAYGRLSAINTDLVVEPAYKSLSLVILDDLFWDEYSNALNLGFLDRNSQNLAQEATFVLAGIRLGYFFFSSEKALPISQAIQFNRVTDSVATLNVRQFLTPFEYGLASLSVLKTQRAFENLVRVISAQKPFELDDHTAALKWFASSGYAEFPTISVPPRVVPDTLYVRVDKIQKKALSRFTGYQTRKLDVNLLEIGLRDTSQHAINFDSLNAEKEVLLNSSPRNVLPTFSANEHPVVVVEFKDESMWGWQMRKAASTMEKVRAAEALASFKDNPDLQLALIDQLNSAENPAIKSAILNTLGEIMGGATGTEQQFLTELRSEIPVIRKGAAEALQHYSGNEQVQSALRSRFRREQDSDVKRSLLVSMASVLDSASFVSAAAGWLLNPDYYDITEVIINELRQKVSDQQLVSLLEPLLMPERPFRQRFLALVHSFNDDSFSEDSVVQLLADHDPRIRYQSWKLLKHKLDLKEQEQWKNRLMFTEYDARVRQLINEDINHASDH